MTDYEHGAASADEYSLMSKYFDLALRMRETENARPDDHPSREPIDQTHAELPPQQTDSE